MSELTNTERMDIFCSTMNEKLGAPYIFSWEPVNYKDPEGKDIFHAHLKVKSTMELEAGLPVSPERTMCVISTSRIVDDFYPINYGLVSAESRYNKEIYPVKSMEDVDSHLDLIKEYLHDFLFTSKY